ncbi:MAG: nitroreductase family protein, partial [Halioglobus sp.]
MSDILSFLQQRCSAPKLTEPAPGPEQLDEMFKVAFRAPDHAWLRPWRFLVISGDRRNDLGELLEQSLVARNPEADEAA